jgi:alkylated DNA repair dioxygenase AlkB
MTYAPPCQLRRAGREVGVPQVLYVPRFLPRQRADALFRTILGEAHWRRERFTLFGREVTAPRLTAWYGEQGASYRYSGVTRCAERWPAAIGAVAREVSERAAWAFDFALVNRFRSGADTLGWHSDDEAALGPEPVIASLTLGAERVFRVRPRQGGASIGWPLGHGSLVLMWGASQRDYKHAVPRTRRAVGERINCTFRRTGLGGRA